MLPSVDISAHFLTVVLGLPLGPETINDLLVTSRWLDQRFVPLGMEICDLRSCCKKLPDPSFNASLLNWAASAMPGR